MVTKTIKAGNPRKSRRKRLNVSSGTGPEKFTPEASDWERIAAAYGQPLGAADRDAIVVLVNQYFFCQPDEANAPFADDALRYLDQLERSGRTFWHIMLQRGSPSELSQDALLKDEALFFVQSRVGQHLQALDFHRKTDWDGLLHTMTDCVSAFRRTRKCIEEAMNSGFVEGRAWNGLIWKLLEFADQRNLPFRISKADEANKSSPFVRFIWELQRSFPTHFRRHDASPIALAQAMSVARRQIKASIAQRAARERNAADRPT
jgi:hypothetical protein